MTKDKPTSWRDVLPIHPAAELFPMLPPDELRVLGEDIKKSGMTSPIKWAALGLGSVCLLDGRNRLDALEAVGVSLIFRDGFSIPVGTSHGDNLLRVERLSGQTDPFAYVLSANIHRRHLTADDKRKLIAAVLKAQPGKSNREIARQVKDDHHKVGAVRRELESTGEVSPVQKTVGKDGKARKQPAPVAKGDLDVKAIADRAEARSRQTQHAAAQMQAAAQAVAMPKQAEQELPPKATAGSAEHEQHKRLAYFQKKIAEAIEAAPPDKRRGLIYGLRWIIDQQETLVSSWERKEAAAAAPAPPPPSAPAAAATETVGPLDLRETRRPGVPNFSVRS